MPEGRKRSFRVRNRSRVITGDDVAKDLERQPSISSYRRRCCEEKEENKMETLF